MRNSWDQTAAVRVKQRRWCPLWTSGHTCPPVFAFHHHVISIWKPEWTQVHPSFHPLIDLMFPFFDSQGKQKKTNWENLQLLIKT